MNKNAVILVLIGGLAAFTQAQTPNPQRTGPTRVTWRTRTLVGDQRLMQWRVGPAAAAFPSLTFVETIAKADSLGLSSIEGSAAQKTSPEISKPFDYRLSADERASVQTALKDANVKLVAYRAGPLPTDEAGIRNVLEFAKAMGADTVVAAAAPASTIKLASDLGVRLGADNDQILIVNVKDGGSTKFFNELNGRNNRPLFLALNATGTDRDAAMLKAVEAFENAVQPVLGAFVVAASKSMPIRSGDSLPADVKAQIEAAIPKAAYAKPKKPRKLLVIDACVANMSHNTIPHFNLAIELMAKNTGAFEAIFDNNLENLRWPKIKEFDAIYLNDTVGELFPDPEIRQSLLRYVREGGGIGGWHGSPWASRSWRELGDMMAAMDAPHRIEPAYMKLDDPKSPINQAFDGTGLQHTEEYYRFNHTGPTGGFYSRDKVHVLLSLDTDKSPEIFKPGRNGQPFYQRPDNDYAVAWIRSYGKGRVFYNSMGHMPATMMSKQIMGHVFGGIQFILGDLEADTTPSAKLAAKK